MAQTVRQSYLMHIYYINLLGNVKVLLFSPSVLFLFAFLFLSLLLTTFMLYNAKGRMSPSTETAGWVQQKMSSDEEAMSKCFFVVVVFVH